MAILSKILSSYQPLLLFILIKLASVKNEPLCIMLVNSAASIYHTVIEAPSFHRKLTVNSNASKGLKERGFTLVELIVTVTVLAIIAMIATPSILTQLAHMEAQRIESQIKNTLTLAKAESYIRRQDLLVCLSNSGGICDRNSYKKLLLFSDKNDNKDYDQGIDDLLEEQDLDPKYSILYLRVGDKRHYTKFWGDSGKPRGHFGHIKYCPTSTYNHTMYQISFNQGGRITYKPNESHPTKCGQ